MVAVCDALLLAMSAHVGLTLRVVLSGSTKAATGDSIASIAVFILITLAAFVAAGAYASETFRHAGMGTARLLAGLSLAAVALALFYLAYPPLSLGGSSALLALFLAGGLLAIVRAGVRLLLGQPILAHRLLIIGTGARAQRIARIAEEVAGMRVVGHLHVEKNAPAVAEAIACDDGASLAGHVARLGATEVVLALEERRNALPLSDLVRLRTMGVAIIDVSSFIERETGRIDLRSTDPSALIFSDGFVSARRLSAAMKRGFDIAAALLLLVLVWPLLLLAAIGIFLDDRGPIFFRQRRVGLYGETFALVKLRSMRVDAEADGRARWAEINDPRVTRLGKWLRLFRIDELPQLWNVLTGDMSFVGPRPERPHFVAELDRKLVYYAERHMVKPGITGWAQVNYPYGASLQDARAKLEFDLYYAKNYTVFLDVLIIFQTTRIILWPEGAR